MEDALLNLEEAATYLRVSRRVLRELYLRRKFSGRLIKLSNLGPSEVDLDAYLGRISLKVNGAYS
jgi:hypothetical protein